MEKVIKIILTIIIGAAILAIGAFIGVMMTKNLVITNTGNPQPQTVEQNTQGSAQNILGSPLVSSVLVSGKLASVSGSAISIVSGTSTLTVTVDSNTKITAYEKSKDAQGNTVIAQKTILLSDLAIGDYLSVNINVLSPGQLVATSINRVPANSGK